MRCALFPVTISVLKDFFRVRVSRAPRSQPLRHLPSPADRARNHILHIVAKLQLHRPTREADMVYSSRAREFLLIVDFFAAKNSVLEFSSCPPYQGRVACGQSSLLVFEWEW